MASQFTVVTVVSVLVNTTVTLPVALSFTPREHFSGTEDTTVKVTSGSVENETGKLTDASVGVFAVGVILTVPH